MFIYCFAGLKKNNVVDDRSGGRKARWRASDEAAEIRSRFALDFSPAFLQFHSFPFTPTPTTNTNTTKKKDASDAEEATHREPTPTLLFSPEQSFPQNFYRRERGLLSGEKKKWSGFGAWNTRPTFRRGHNVAKMRRKHGFAWNRHSCQKTRFRPHNSKSGPQKVRDRGSGVVATRV